MPFVLMPKIVKFNRSGLPSVRISRKGEMSFGTFPSVTWKEQGLTRMLLWWDAENLLMGISLCRPEEDTEKIGYWVTTKTSGRSKNNGALINAARFLTRIGWRAAVPVSIPLAWDSEKNLWIASIPRECLSGHSHGEQVPTA